ncbi:hypothetical protein [Thalassoroseus pseudoceratinae]|uniref:hypothetical protein n=1 Tax=Thalassoroseus pseudoceratinae TaxID=2713176 RepID=UPI00142311D9|nr:hypothetical protein [Thalassoroseus pseudoceratinae]
MSDTFLTQLETTCKSDGPAAAIDSLIGHLREQKNYDRLFDALLLKKRNEMGMPLAMPTALDDLPEDRRREFEDYYVEAAREVGELFLADDNVPRAWPYLRTIGETDKVRHKLDEMPLPNDIDDSTEELIQLCLHQGAHPAKGLEIMLHTHGTCNTITAFDQALQAQLLQGEDQQQAAAMLVNELYDDLKRTVQQDVEQRIAMAPPTDSLRELIAGRDWLFENGNYHIDVSHLNSTVRFARCLERGAAELPKVLQLAEYGAKLSDQLQYPGEPPFDDFYPAHIHFFKAILGENVDEHIAYFQAKLDQEPDEQDKPYLAYELVTLLTKIDRLDDAVEVGKKHLRSLNDPNGFSFLKLCQQAGQTDAWREAARDNDDAVGFLAAVVHETSAG